MAYKPEMIPAHSYLAPKAAARARRTAKKAAARLVRRAAKRDPEGAPTRVIHGWID